MIAFLFPQIESFMIEYFKIILFFLFSLPHHQFNGNNTYRHCNLIWLYKSHKQSWQGVLVTTSDFYYSLSLVLSWSSVLSKIVERNTFSDKEDHLSMTSILSESKSCNSILNMVLLVFSHPMCGSWSHNCTSAWIISSHSQTGSRVSESTETETLSQTFRCSYNPQHVLFSLV